jgi:hypothetical protein
MNIVLNPKMEGFAAILGLSSPLHNRIEDAEVEIELESSHARQDQRQAANEEMNRGSK